MRDDQAERYSRHILLNEIGGTGQRRLLQSRVLVVGAGGLGSAALLYLAAAGVGRIRVVGHDRVDLGNLQRQILHETAALDLLKVESAAHRLRALNPDCRVEPIAARFDGRNAAALFDGVDVALDGCDDPATRYVVNRAAIAAHTPLVSASIVQFDGQLTTFKAYSPGDHPCYRCLYPSAGAGATCSAAGVLGPLAGVMGAMQAVEAIKELLGIGVGLSGRLVLYDGRDARIRTMRLRRRPDCPDCAPQPAGSGSPESSPEA